MSREELMNHPLFWVAAGLVGGYAVVQLSGGGGGGGGAAQRSEPTTNRNAVDQILQICDTCTPVRPTLEYWAAGNVPTPYQLVKFAQQI
jgi:hypothetical protein